MALSLEKVRTADPFPVVSWFIDVQVSSPTNTSGARTARRVAVSLTDAPVLRAPLAATTHRVISGKPVGKPRGHVGCRR